MDLSIANMEIEVKLRRQLLLRGSQEGGNQRMVNPIAELKRVIKERKLRAQRLGDK
jgi:hypothetical protein